MVLNGNSCQLPGIRKNVEFWVIVPLLILAFTACNSSHDIPTPKNSLNVVIIVMDTARQDRFACYGYGVDTSPNLTKLSTESMTYTNAYAPGGWTISSHASLFTGLFPIAHQTTQEQWRMGDHLTTLAEVFSAEGYETIGIVENAMLNTDYNFNQGFSQYYETWRFPNKKENTAFALLRKALDERNTNRPFLVFINLIEPHSPYNSSKQFYYRFISDRSIKIERTLWREYFTGSRTFTDDEIRHLGELYDAEILYTDFIVGNIIQELEKRDLWTETVFIVTSDHGENIGDHEMMDHVFSLHESIIKVPLIIHYSKLFTPGASNEIPVQLTDIFPTLLEIIGVDPKQYLFQGQSLLGRKAGDNIPVFSEYYYPIQALESFNTKGMAKKYSDKTPLLDPYKRQIRAVIKEDMKLIWGSDGNHELFNLRQDPGERQNLITRPEDAKSAQALLTLLENLVEKYDIKLQKATHTEEGELDEVTRERLKSLGYIE